MIIRTIGILIVGIAALMVFITFSFNKAFKDIIVMTCSHGPTCPMYKAIDPLINVNIGLAIFTAAIGIYLIFFGKEEKIITKVEQNKITKEDYQKILSNLSDDERLVLEKIIEAQGMIFQSNLVKSTGFSKSKISRILDKLENIGLIERKRYGMTNIVILKRQ